MSIIPFAIIFLLTLIISIMWASGIEKNKDINKDDIEFP